MKKSILAVSAAAAIGGLGFAGAAHAVYYNGDGGAAPGNTYVGITFGNVAGFTHSTRTADATHFRLNEGGLGHHLFTPYFTTQGDNNTLITLVNTDTVNGKIVKVRFRGAANSEDLFDFQLFMSPGDVWSASLSQGSNGLTKIETPDSSCTLPEKFVPGGANAIWDSTFRTNRLVTDAGGTTAAQRVAQTREGYIEFLNMADIAAGSPLFVATKHNVNGKAPCDTAFANLVPILNNTSKGNDTNGMADPLNVTAMGMSAPSGGLSGSWFIYSNAAGKAYGDNHIAVAATDVSGNPRLGRITYSPQVTAVAPNDFRDETTADPVLRATSAQFQDIPDMSTPMVKGSTDPLASITGVSQQLSKATISNEYVATLGDLRATQPYDTDWVVSHATRRYYATLAQNGAVVQNARNSFYRVSMPAVYPNPNPVTGGNLTVQQTAGGTMLCQAGSFGGYDREEGQPGATFSPSLPQARHCGEVSTLTFNNAQSVALSAAVTNTRVSLTNPLGQPSQAGWAWLTFSRVGPLAAVAATDTQPAQPAVVGLGAPVVGYSATSLINTTTQSNFGTNTRHRYTIDSVN